MIELSTAESEAMEAAWDQASWETGTIKFGSNLHSAFDAGFIAARDFYDPERVAEKTQDIVRANAERDVRLTFDEARNRMLAAIEDARQAHVTPTGAYGNLFGKGPEEQERLQIEGVDVIALANFNAALDEAFPVRDTPNRRTSDD